MAHICGYCSHCLERITTGPGAGVETRGRLGQGQCCHCNQTAELYGRVGTDTNVVSDGKTSGPGRVRRS